jgi:triphosphoribosyl-dephospho-CoA synthase
MEASISLLKPYLSEIADAAGRNAKLEELKEIGKRAEENMFRECGTNTHKGYIFLSGLVILSLMKYKNIREGISRESAKFFKMDIPESNGSTTRKVYHIDGICGECMNGMPSVFEHSLPAMRSVFKNTYDEYPAKLMAMAKLMQHVQDTTSYHRCGEQGIEIIKKDGAELESILMEGGNPKVWLVEKNEQYKNIRLTMGGVADLLGITFALYRLYTD